MYLPGREKIVPRRPQLQPEGIHRSKIPGPKSACIPCHIRSKCLSHPDRTPPRQVAFFTGRNEKGKSTFTEKMKKKIDSAIGRIIYSKWVGAVESVFANICHAIGLKYFTLRGQAQGEHSVEPFLYHP
ncbi:MAG: transposase [Proteobacteria bacterium]|nr:transposase [Pseudomonadota bacterium]